MNFCEDSRHQTKNSLYLNNNNFEMDKNTPGCFSKSLEERPSEEFQNLNEVPVESDDVDSDENQVNLSDSYDELPVSDEDEDVQLSSPSNSLNSDVDQRWYAFRGRWNINNRRLDNQLPENNQPQLQQQQQQEEEETDFLEMDFEPDTNSEIENEATLPNGNQHSSNSGNSYNFLNLPSQPLQQPEFRLIPNQLKENPDNYIRPVPKNTGAKPKLMTVNSRPQKVTTHASEGDNVFKLCSINNNISLSSKPSHSSSIYSNAINSDEVYNLGASSSRSNHDSNRLYQDPHHQSFNHDVMKIHKSPSKSSSHHNNKHQRLHEEQNDQFLFEIEPIKPRNSVTIYTTNCDEKVLIDALKSLNLEPNRDMISSYFNRSKPSTSTSGTASNCELNLVDYIVYRSKLNCNYLKLVELIQKACKDESEDSYKENSFEVNFYPLDLFSTTPEMVDVSVEEIVQRWTPQTDLSPLVNIKNKYFYQTNVLGKVVGIIRKINQKPPATFKDKETIKIPQFYVSGYITITLTKLP